MYLPSDTVPLVPPGYGPSPHGGTGVGVALGTGPTLPAVAIEEVRVPVGADMNVCVCTYVAGTKTALHVCT